MSAQANGLGIRRNVAPSPNGATPNLAERRAARHGHTKFQRVFWQDPAGSSRHVLPKGRLRPNCLGLARSKFPLSGPVPPNAVNPFCALRLDVLQVELGRAWRCES